MKIHALLFSLLLIIPLTGCTGSKPLGIEWDSVYCHGYDTLLEGAGGEDILSFTDEDNCEGWTNEIALEPGEVHIIDNRQYDTNVSLYFQSDVVVGSNSTTNVNLYSLTETNYNDFMACEAFSFIEEFSWLNVSSSPIAGPGHHSVPTFTFDPHGEDVYLVIDNWHCEDKPDGTETGNVFVYYEIGIVIETGAPL